ncbi:MAG: hypothetical protein ACI4TK_19400 [Agathobacter sp.]
MTAEEAIVILENERPSCGEKVVYPEGERCEAYDMAISALRAQQELESNLKVLESNAPLTLDELREMDGEPVWWWNASANPVCMICVFDRFMTEPMFANYDFVSEDSVNLTKYKWLKKCGYKPYRRKPEEGTR